MPAQTEHTQLSQTQREQPEAQAANKIQLFKLCVSQWLLLLVVVV